MGDLFDHNRVGFLTRALAPQRKTRVVDVGANPTEAPAYSQLLALGGCEVWGFEPQPDAYEKLRNTAGDNEHYLPHAVGDGTRRTLHICQVGGFTSLLRPNAGIMSYMNRYRKGMKVVDHFEVDTRRLDDLDDLPVFDLLKIDIQGGEQDVFTHGTNKLGTALAVITEVAAVPLYEDQPLLDDQMRALRGLGFDLHKFQTFKQRRIRNPHLRGHDGPGLENQLIDGDAVFLRGLLRLEEHDTEALKHMAILADAVIDSFDLCVRILSALEARGAVSADMIDAYVARLPGFSKGAVA